MANKKYNEFTTGTYDTEKIFLQADPSTGELTKVNLPNLTTLLTPANNVLSESASINTNEYSFKVVTSENDNVAQLSISATEAGHKASIDVYTEDGAEAHIGVTQDDCSIEYSDDSVAYELLISASGVYLSGLPEFASNAAAIAAGLSVNNLYRQGDLLAIVH